MLQRSKRKKLLILLQLQTNNNDARKTEKQNVKNDHVIQTPSFVNINIK